MTKATEAEQAEAERLANDIRFCGDEMIAIDTISPIPRQSTARRV